MIQELLNDLTDKTGKNWTIENLNGGWFVSRTGNVVRVFSNLNAVISYLNRQLA